MCDAFWVPVWAYALLHSVVQAQLWPQIVVLAIFRVVWEPWQEFPTGQEELAWLVELAGGWPHGWKHPTVGTGLGPVHVPRPTGCEHRPQCRSSVRTVAGSANAELATTDPVCQNDSHVPSCSGGDNLAGPSREARVALLARATRSRAVACWLANLPLVPRG